MLARAHAWAGVLAIALVLMLLTAAPGAAWHRVHGGVHIGVGPMWWGAPYWPYAHWPYAPYYPYHPYWDPYWRYWPAPVIVQQEPPVYIQQPAPALPAPPEAYWYYCPSARGYYPTVRECPEPWVKVPPRP
jgi:hypothetical protein